MAAQTHHYVPRFVLRQFLKDADKEQVAVYDTHDDRSFVTSIKNIMSERRFNEFEYEDFIVSFENVASRIEESILPRYQKILAKEELEGTADEKADLSFLIAFQLIRVKAMRDLLVGLEGAVRQTVEKLGRTMEQVKGWTPLPEETLKLLHLKNMPDTIGKFAQVIAEKDMFLARAAPGTSFYLGDNPVARHNKLDFGPYGSIGLAVKGIEIYLPLSSDLTLCALCPSIWSSQFKENSAMRNRLRGELQRMAILGNLTFEEAGKRVAELERQCEKFDRIGNLFAKGQPIDSDEDNMSYNSLQARWSHRYIVDKRGDFTLAKRHNQEFPRFKYGHKPGFE